KGVTVAMNLAEALAALDACFDGSFGQAGAEVVVEEFLTGEEASFFCLCDGVTALPFGTAQDHKRLSDGDVGPNTGGMGAYSPAPVMTPEMIDRT
ncbi:MAG: phosphoribosylamine--glycine ligase, partial [Mesorhizobium sp.]